MQMLTTIIVILTYFKLYFNEFVIQKSFAVLLFIITSHKIIINNTIINLMMY